MPPAQWRLRNWLFDRVLSGDIIVEQNIHAIDICNWVLQGHPVKAVGTGGRRGRSEPGNVYGHCAVSYWYPNEVQVSFASKQFGKGAFDVSERFFGARGESQSPYSGPLGITGEENWTCLLYTSGYREEPAGGAGPLRHRGHFADCDWPRAGGLHVSRWAAHGGPGAAENPRGSGDGPI